MLLTTNQTRKLKGLTCILFLFLLPMKPLFSQAVPSGGSSNDLGEKNFRFVPLPYINYSRSVGFAFGLIPMAMYKVNPEDTISPASISGIGGIYTTNETWFGMFFQRFYLDEDNWRWRLRMAENIASQMDPERFGVKYVYVFGSTKNAVARPDSDIDLLIHFGGTDEQRQELLTWLNGWSLCLSEVNYWWTGVETDGLLDIQIVTDEDIKNRTSYSLKIGAVTDPARQLTLKNDVNKNDE